MLLSIIVPAYNVENYIEKCINSLVTQNGINYEILIINDGSTDSTLSIAKKIEMKYDNVTVINQENKGLGGARNTGIIHAKGSYITFVDSDDYLIPNTYGTLFEKAGHESFDIACFNFVKVNEGEEVVVVNNENLSKEVLNNEEIRKYFYINKITSYAWDKVYDIELFRKNHILFPEKKLYEDLRTSYEIIIRANKVLKIDFNGYMYLQRNGSITKNIKRKNLDDFTSEYIKVLDSIEKTNDFKDEVSIYKVLKYNAIVRMKMKMDRNDYVIDDRIKIKLPIKKLLSNKDLRINEKIINFVGENKLFFHLFKNVNKLVCKKMNLN